MDFISVILFPYRLFLCRTAAGKSVQLVYAYIFSILPDTLQIIEQAVFLIKHMDDDIAKIKQHPAR